MSGDEFAGTLTQRVTIERRAGDRDQAGGATGGWPAIATTFAAIAPAGTTDIEAGEALDARPRWGVTMRPADVIFGDRLRWGARLLAVRSVVADPRTPDRMMLECEEERG